MHPPLWIAPLLALAVTTTLPAAEPATQHAPTRSAWPQRQIVSGRVEDASGHRVHSAIVFLLKAESGLPYSNVTDHPFRDMHVAGEPPLIAHAATSADGRFHIRGVFPGTYRLVAQSWQGIPSLPDLDKLASDTTTLRGIAENVRASEQQEPTPILLKPIGSASVTVTLDSDDTFLLVSTSPLSADPLLGPIAWKGDFLRHLVGATYLRKGKATLHGLPEGLLYCYALQNDRQFGRGEASVTAKPGRSVEVSIPLLSPLNGPLKLPDRLAPLAEALKHNRQAVDAAAQAALGTKPAASKYPIDFDTPWDRQFPLPDGGTATLRDLSTVYAYERFNRQARELADRPGAATQRAVP
jgi:hypothetical protein